MLKMFSDNLNTVLSETSMLRLSVYGKHEVVVYLIELKSLGTTPQDLTQIFHSGLPLRTY